MRIPIIRTFLAALVLSISLGNTAVAREGLDGKVTIDISPSQHETLPGGNITFIIKVRNYDVHTQNDVDVSFLFDRKSLAIIETLPNGGTFAQEGIALWNIDEIFAGQTWSAQFPVQMESNVNAGDFTDVTARVSGHQINVANSTVMDSVTVGAAIFPATGVLHIGLLSSMVLMLGALVMLVIQRKFASQ